MTVRHFNLVLPLAQKATAMRNMETTDSHQNKSSAVTLPISTCFGESDIDSKATRSTPLIQIMPGIRTLKMETRTTTTRTTSLEPALSADYYAGYQDDLPTFADLVTAYFDCRKNKRNTKSALDFEQHLELNLANLYEELIAGTYAAGKSICFVITRPKPREVWAADFRDRIVHHLYYNKISPRFYAMFIADTCACIPGRGTLYADKRLEHKIRSATENWSKQCFYLKCDLANFFVSIDKDILYTQIAKKVQSNWWLALTRTILFHDPRLNYALKGNPTLLNLVPAHKKLTNQPENLGLPIGNLSSQFFANIYLNSLDQHIKHQLKAKHYIRYVDDFIILHESAQWLNNALKSINAFLPAKLNAQLNPSKTILQPVDRGVDFVGQVIKPWHRYTRKRTVKEAIKQVKSKPDAELYESANSYFGLLIQATSSHQDRCKLANVLRNRGHTINKEITKTYRKSA